ncbi:hypothetical protein CK510_20825 [Brunnivagina elsteri CCALA 953]|uniref:Low-complexity protein n=1 Tax=Brunnivagina elsteri CCALA 953 TaxID=987040 RepID=A0A2A2TEU8_9CYAN|nr:pentapeptide repeat-containing protein [Calothrix elsteri]PAX52158.1 hypothetical protein CK510_20825 [Calothrix elsteri CCALA 953]
MKFWQLLTSFVLAFLLLFPVSAQAASSSGVTGSTLLQNLKGKDFSGQSLVGEEYTSTNLENANFSNADMRGVVFNGTLLHDVDLHGIDFQEGIAYLSDFRGANLSDAVLTNAMMLRSLFDNVNVTNADFTNAVLDRTEIKKLCATASGVNGKTGVSTRESLGCKDK